MFNTSHNTSIIVFIEIYCIFLELVCEKYSGFYYTNTKSKVQCEKLTTNNYGTEIVSKENQTRISKILTHAKLSNTHFVGKSLAFLQLSI